MDQLTQDLRQAIRFLRRRPLLTGAAALTLALGIGASTALFSIVQGVLLEPLPYDAPDRLTTVSARFDRQGTLRAPLAGPEVHDAATFVAVSGVALATAFLAAGLPARRAAAVEPAGALRG